MKHLHLCKLMLVAVTTAWATAANAATQITLRENVEMTKYLVRLGDIAEIACDDAEQARDLASLPLMPAPAAGSQQFVSRRKIEDSLATHGVDLQAVTMAGAAQVTISGPRAATSRPGPSVTNALSEVDSTGAATINEGLCRLISSYLKTKSPEAGTYTVTCQLPPRHLASLAGAMSQPSCQGGAAPWTGRQRFEISFESDAGPTTFAVYADVQPEARPVVVASRAMARGEVLTAADVELQELNYVTKPGERRVPTRSVDAVVGMEVRQPIPAGSIVYADSLQSPSLVKRGELIRITSQSGGIRVRTTARALQDRSHGQLVEVESLTTKERFDARVVGPGEAAIVGIATPATAAPAAAIQAAQLR